MKNYIENLSEIEMDPYIHELVESLKNSFKSDLINIHFNFDRSYH